MTSLKTAVAVTALFSLGGLAQAFQAESQVAPTGRQRCGYDDKRFIVHQGIQGGQATDCNWQSTNPDITYAPTYIYSVPIVFHVIEHTNGDGALSPATIQDQIDVLNEDFRAIQGSPGAPGLDVMVQFHLATVDPDGQPTTGITRSVNDAWHMDEYTTPGYWEVLQWDPLRYLNVYTLNTVGYYGYYWGSPGSIEDGVYLWWPYVGDNSSSTAANDNYGRTATHEIGHYFGLHHTFEGGCAGGSCYSSGDLICDTNPHASATWGCPSSQSSCGSQVPIRNYMNYTDDNCMWEFTEEQARRMRCRIEWYRPALADIVSGCGIHTIYCDTAPNSVGAGALIGYAGSFGITANDLEIKVSGAPPGQFGLFYYGLVQAQQPFGDGYRCIAGQFYRLPVVLIDGAGVGAYAMDYTNPPALSGEITVGSTWNFQFWYRDPAAGGASFNLSDALTTTFCP
ncbi:MAG: zinc metalloprotease [bacterium]